MPDTPELALALKYMDEIASRERTRVVCVYGLSGLVVVGHDKRFPLSGISEFGSFSPHIELAGSLLPAPVLTIRDAEAKLPGQSLGLGPVQLTLLVTPRGDAALVLDGHMTGNPDAQATAALLRATCQERERLLLSGQPALDLVRAEATAAGLQLPDLAFGRNVHQCVFPGGDVLAGIRAGEPFWRMINRVAAPEEPRSPVAVFRPPELNYQSVTAVGHGRGVSVIAGFAEAVENACALIVVMLVTGLSVLHRSREHLFAAMDRASRPATSSHDGREVISYLSAQLNELQLDLEFGVESYLDSVLIPEAFIDTFQRSLSEAMGLSDALAHSSQMLDRLTAVIQARGLALEAAFQEQAERRDQLFSRVLAIATLLAVPPTLLLTYFALGPGAARSVLDVRAHWGAYLIAWVPFIVLVGFAWVGRRRITSRGPGARKQHRSD
jgi:hypothetical protein